jgi:hypothetical protein
MLRRLGPHSRPDADWLARNPTGNLPASPTEAQLYQNKV